MDVTREAVAEAVGPAIAETFANMAFLDAVPSAEAEEEAPPVASWCWGRVDLRSPLRGEHLLLCPRDLAADITELLFGMETEAVTDGMIHDAMAEFVNTVAGRILGALVPMNQTFELGLAEGGDGWRELGGATYDAEWMVDDGRRLRVFVRLEG